MAETTENLEKLISKLKSDGLEAGRLAGEKAVESANKEADRIITEANLRAEKIISAANEEAKKRTTQAKSELSLAVRDALLTLRQGIANTVAKILNNYCDNRLNDSGFLSNLIENVVRQYVMADVAGKNPSIVVQENVLPVLRDSLIANLSADNGIKLIAGLKEAGFEFVSANGTIEITASSVSEVLAKYVNAEIQDMIKDSSAA